MAEEREGQVGEARSGFFIVGLGASAGGLEALNAVLGRLNLERIAAVVVLHLAPQRESSLASVLSRSTRATVVEAKDGMKVAPNHVYVIPPDADLSLLQGVLKLTAPTREHGVRLPIDFFMRALAQDQGSRSAGVVLSGSGTDGTFGLKAIKEAGGITFAQEPGTAQYDSMPKSALDAGWADFSLPPAGIAEELNNISRHPYLLEEHPPASAMQEHVGKLIVLMRGAFGIDLASYKPSTIERRIERRMALHKLEKLDDYVKLVQSQPEELKLLYKDMLISVTEFFRDTTPFETVKQRVFSQILERKEPGGQIRVWVPACATGEEAYSYAIALLEFLGDDAHDYRIQIFGTDIDEDSIAFARRGCYPPNITLDLSPERLHRFFVKRDNEYQVSRRIRDMVVFSVQNVTKDPPFSRIDLVSCRNLLIYLQPPMQKRVLRILHYALNPVGFLVLGSSETVGESSELFSLLDRKNKLYAKKLAPASTPLEIGFGVPAADGPRPIQPNMSHRSAATISSLADRKILELFGPPGVVINEDLEVVHIRGRTGPFLEPMPGAPSFNILKLARPEIHVDLRRAIHEAQTRGTRVTLDSRLNDDGAARHFQLEVVPISDPETKARCLLVLFHEPGPRQEPQPGEPAADAASAEAQRLQELERELMITKEYLQSTIEELESGSEELKSSNEELQSSNEELQSTNEELETSKEELQSANEELTTVNDELQNRMSELQLSNDDLHNVLGGIGNVVLIVGMDLRIRRYTHTAEKLLNLVPGDVGRSVTMVNAFVVGQRLEELAAEVIAHLKPVERDVLCADQRWYTLSVTPYKTLDHSIKGAVVVLVDVDSQKRSEGGSRSVQSALELFQIVGDSLLVIDRGYRALWANEALMRRFGISGPVPGEPLSTFAGGALGDKQLATLLELTLTTGTPFRDYRSGAMIISGARIPDTAGDAARALLAVKNSG